MSKKGIGGWVAETISATAIMCLATQPLLAASSGLSSVRYVTDNGGSSAPSFNQAPAAGATSTTAVFDVTISLEENPQGDDKYPDEPGASDDAQNKFEKKIEEFADAVFQSTNGKHKIGKVTIFRNGRQANNVDVKWKKDCPSGAGPRANPSGFGVTGSHIYFCTNWPGAPSLMDTPKGAGFTLAHEWGHYAYGIYDEYIANCGQVPETNCTIFLPRSTDTQSSPSIMNNQWTAVSGSQDWLEFSTENVEPYKTKADGDNKNGQARVFKENNWATLTRDPATDPRHTFLSTRTQYTNLVAPVAPNFIVADNEATARSELKIIWAGNQVVELMIDTSGSMGGTPMANAKAAGSLLVGQLEPGKTAVGVGRFTSSASQAYAITDIPDPDTGIRSAAQAAIATFNAGGGTDIEEAALLALSELQAFQGGTRPSVAFLLTDGRSSVNVSHVVAQYKAAKVPLITFGFGSNVDTALLQSLASGTGGQYFFSPTDLAAIQQAFIAANAAVSSSVVVSSATAASAGNTTEVRPVVLDSTMAMATLNLTYDLPQTDVTLRLLSPDGTEAPVAFTCDATTQVTCDVEVDVATLGAGEYGVEITNTTANEKDASLLVSGTSSTFENFDIALEFSNVNYPESFALRATVSKGAALSGLDVTATLTKPDTSTVEIALLDDGKNADLYADDGVYSADVPYDQSGTYSAVIEASNASGNAQTTFNNVAIALGENGTAVAPVPVAVPEAFTRTAVATATVSAFAADDHADDPTVPAACTPVSDDNVDTVGRIDAAGDVDCFYFTPTATTDDLIARITSLRSNITPIIRVYDSTGQTELLSVDLTTSANAASGVIATIPAASLDAAGHVVTVEHSDAAAAEGGYAVSVGSPLASDVALVSAPGDDDTGGAVGPWSLIVGLILAAFGLRRRRVLTV